MRKEKPVVSEKEPPGRKQESRRDGGGRDRFMIADLLSNQSKLHVRLKKACTRRTPERCTKFRTTNILFQTSADKNLRAS